MFEASSLIRFVNSVALRHQPLVLIYATRAQHKIEQNELTCAIKEYQNSQIARLKNTYSSDFITLSTTVAHAAFYLKESFNIFPLLHIIYIAEKPHIVST
jgi:hypothetical protein